MQHDRVQGSAQAKEPSASGVRSAGDPGALGPFLAELLAVQCRCCRARGGAVLQLDGGGGFRLVAVHPAGGPEQEPTSWLRRSAEAANQVSSSTVAVTLPVGGDLQTHVVVVPLRIADQGPLVTTLLLKTADKMALDGARQLLELTVGLVGMTGEHLSRLGQETAPLKLHSALDVLAGINRQNRFRGVAMALCNEMASQWQCERVSVGFLKGRYVQVKAMSHTGHFSRKMRLVQDIEAAMEECLDQDCEVIYPPSADAAYIARAAGELSDHHGRNALMSLPLREDGRSAAVVTLERVAAQAFTDDQAETIRLACDLCAPRLLNLYHYDRWIGARIAANARRGLAVVLGAQYTWTKLAILGGLALLLFLVFAKGWYKVKAPFVFEAVSQCKIAAPFDGFIKDVDVEVGDAIVEGRTALAELDTAELRLQLASARAEKAGYLKQSDAAMRDGKTAEAQIAQAGADKAQAQMDLLSYRIGQARILSPVTGTLVAGDLKRQIGAPVETGKVLFEVAPLDSLRAGLYVSEDEVSDVAVGQEGYLATATYPGDRIRFVVERVNPAAEVVNNRNVFKVRAKLSENRPWMRPGMEGVAKVTIEKRHYAWIWTRKVVNWIRMKLWL
ncbi:MAG: HlyD family efflux transporter periplasmic adaptor subunit [Sedimentisphaerales bacterium]|nr:HlyD family efflux transporter periplasmic adaptor subunit [Sedimentisphaerales bacterium]